jgi:hypothetical protein
LQLKIIGCEPFPDYSLVGTGTVNFKIVQYGNILY